MDINFRYLSTGLKVGQDASWVGLGWSMNVGGVITRTVRGKNDLSGGYYNDALPLPPYADHAYYPAASSNTAADHLYFNNIYDGQIDGEPDIFYYNFGGHQGKFVLDKVANGGLAYVSVRDNLKIEVLDPHNHGKWIITDPNGYKFYFNTPELSFDNTSTSEVGEILQQTGNQYLTEAVLPNVTAWYLDSIVSPNKEKITFEYIRDRYSLSLLTKYYESSFAKQLHISYCDGGGLPPTISRNYMDYASSRQRTLDVYLRKITFTNGYVYFDTSSREDIEGYNGQTPAKLDGIRVYDDNNNLIKRFLLHQTYFSNGGTEYYNKRLKLDSVSIYGSSKIASYTFNYFEPSGLPSKYSKAVDHWGYYNAAGDNQALLPSAVVQQLPSGHYNYLDGGNRLPSTDVNDLKKGVLSEITYPTGGKTVFEYELNNYSNLHPSELFTLVPASKIVTSGLAGSGNVLVQNFVLTEQTPVKFLLDFAGNPDNGILGYLRKSGTDIKNFYHGEPPTTLVLEAGNYSLHVNELPDRLIYITASWYNKIYNTSNKGGGLRIKKITNFDPSNIASVKRYIYTVDGAENSNTSGMLLSKPVYSTEFLILDSEILTGSGFAFQCYYSITYFIRKSSSIVPFGYSPHEQPIGYSTITELVGENGEGGKTVYTYKNNPDVVYYEGPGGARKVFTDNGKLTGVSVYNSSNQPVKKTLYEYTLKEQYSIKGISILSTKLSHPFAKDPEGNYVSLPPVHYYDNISEWSVNTKITEKVYDGNNSTDIIKIFTYDSPIHKQITKEDVTQSNGSNQIIQYKYPQDYESSLPASPGDDDGKALKNLISRYIISPVIERQVLVKRANITELVSGELTKYKLYSGRALPAELYKLEAATPLSGTVQSSYVGNTGLSFNGHYKPKVYFDAYDTYGNLLQFHEADGTNNVFTWGYEHSLPIAECKHTASNQVFYTSFEEDGEGIAAANQGSLIFKTGKKVKATPYTFTFTPLPGSKMSYWFYIGSWQFSGEVPFNSTITSGQYIDEVRVYPPGARMVTYTYNPLLGMTSQSDENNKVTYFEYDHFGRLEMIRDDKRNILKTFEYNFRK